MRKRIVYDDGTDSIIEGDIEITIGDKKKVAEENLDYLSDEDFKKISDNPRKYKLKKRKVTFARK